MSQPSKKKLSLPPLLSLSLFPFLLHTLKVVRVCVRICARRTERRGRKTGGSPVVEITKKKRLLSVSPDGSEWSSTEQIVTKPKNEE